MTNFSTQIFCANSLSTNKYAADLIGKDFITFKGTSYDMLDKASMSTHERRDYIIPPEHFTTLRTGGKSHKFQVDTIVHVRGKNWSTDENFLEVTFDQRGRQPGFWQKIFKKLKSLFT